MNDLVNTNMSLPELPRQVLPSLNALTTALEIPRGVLASDEEIESAWNNLPRQLRQIPSELRGELIARMCVAVSTGLFDGALNYIWNASILRLRDKIRIFGLPIVAQIQEKDFEERHLIELQDSQLLDLCLKLNILNEDGFFFLDQCRSIRNNFSAAHPTMGEINDTEFTNFLNRCVKYALADFSSPKGVDFSSFISAIKGSRFTESQLALWIQRLSETHNAQRKMLVVMVHGLYCDSSSAEFIRLNSIDLCMELKDGFTSSIKSELINKHSDYLAKGLTDKHTASLQFFEKLGLLSLLNESEKHSIFSHAVEKLWNVHNGMNNFYNEPAFAERLLEISSQNAVPETVQEDFVETVVCCRIGNGYGVSNNAVQYYDEIIQGFSPREVAILINLCRNNESILYYRINNKPNCKTRLKKVLAFIEPETIPRSVKADFDYFYGNQ